MRGNQMKRLTVSLVCGLLAICTGCTNLPSSSGYEGEGMQPEQTAPASSQQESSTPTPAPTEEPVKAIEFKVGPLEEGMEIVTSLADYAAPYNRALEQQEELALYQQDGKMGVIRLDGTIVVPAEENVHWCEVCGIVNEDESKIFDHTGSVVGVGGHGIGGGNLFYEPTEGKLYTTDYEYLIPYQTAQGERGQLITAVPVRAITEGEGYYQNNGDTYTPVQLGDIQGYYLFHLDGTKAGDTLWQDIRYHGQSDMYTIQLEGKWGYCSHETGEVLLAPAYEEVLPFWNGRAAVKTSTGWGYIDLTGKEQTPMDFLQATTADSSRCAWVKTEQGWGVIDLQEVQP